MIWAVLLLIVAFVAAYAWSANSLIVQPGNVAHFYRNGAFVANWDAGFHRWFDPFRRARVLVMSTSPVLPPSYEFTVMTQDQFSFRMTLQPVLEVKDSRTFAETNASVGRSAVTFVGPQLLPTIQPKLAAALLERVSQRTLETVLGDTKAILGEVLATASDAVPGAEMTDLLLTSIVMPPEIRKMFTEVERSKREALAALERARGEQASLRALANAARLLEANPNLGRLRMIQLIEASKGAKSFVIDPASNGSPPASAP